VRSLMLMWHRCKENICRATVTIRCIAWRSRELTGIRVTYCGASTRPNSLASRNPFPSLPRSPLPIQSFGLAIAQYLRYESYLVAIPTRYTFPVVVRVCRITCCVSRNRSAQTCFITQLWGEKKALRLLRWTGLTSMQGQRG
jgi:hypothetical protein